MTDDELLAELFRCNDSESGLIWDAMFFWPFNPTE